MNQSRWVGNFIGITWHGWMGERWEREWWGRKIGSLLMSDGWWMDGCLWNILQRRTSIFFFDWPAAVGTHLGWRTFLYSGRAGLGWWAHQGEWYRDWLFSISGVKEKPKRAEWILQALFCFIFVRAFFVGQVRTYVHSTAYRRMLGQGQNKTPMQGYNARKWGFWGFSLHFRSIQNLSFSFVIFLHFFPYCSTIVPEHFCPRYCRVQNQKSL